MSSAEMADVFLNHNALFCEKSVEAIYTIP